MDYLTQCGAVERVKQISEQSIYKAKVKVFRVLSKNSLQMNVQNDIADIHLG